MPFTAGETVGQYRILQQLGQGGMATVYKAYHPRLDRYVAIKVLHPAFTEDSNFQARFEREARLVARLEHVNIVPIYDFAEHEGLPYLVMKFVEGETLKARLSRGPIEKDEMLRVIEAVGGALAYAHRQGILHRDIKPSNVILANDGQVYLADFGLARIAAASGSTLSADMLVGTPQYISPEQARGDRELDQGTDIYSFGVMLYEMVVGQVPFHADTPFAIIHDHIYTPLPLPSLKNPQVTEAVERVLLKSLAKERFDRYEDVPTMVAAFRQAVEAGSSSQIAEAEAVLPSEAIVTAAAGTVLPVESQEREVKPAQVDTVILPPSREPKPQAGKSKRRKWLWIVPLVLFVICVCLFALGSLSENQKKKTAAMTDEAKATAVAPSETDPVKRARLAVQENPGDPYVHYELAKALNQSGQSQASIEELKQAFQLAGDSVDFYLTTGQDLINLEAWTTAALVYLRLAQVLKPLPVEAVTGLHESIHKAAAAPDFYDIISADALAGFDQSLAGTARARHELFMGAPIKAEAALALVLRREPRYPEALLVQAEIFMHNKLNDKAQPILESINGNPELPEWIHREAERLSNKINP